MKDNNILVSVMAELAIENGKPFPLEKTGPFDGDISNPEEYCFIALETALRGYQPGELIAAASFGGYPAKGVRMFLLNTALNAAVRGTHGGVMFLSMNTPVREIVKRFLSILSGLSLPQIEGRGLNDKEWKTLCDAYFSLLGLDLLMPDIPDPYTDAIDALLGREEHVGLVVIDSIQAMSENDPDACRGFRDKNKSVACELHGIAAEKRIAVLCGAVIPRPLHRGESERPSLVDFSRTVCDHEFAKVILFYGNARAPMELYAASVKKNRCGCCVREILAADDSGRMSESPELEELFGVFNFITIPDDELPF